MDIPNLFTEDTDFNICLSWLCGSTEGQTYSINDFFCKKIKILKGMSESEFWGKVNDFFISPRWDEAIGAKHDYKIDDPKVTIEARQMAHRLNALIERLNVDPDYRHWDDKKESVYIMECKKDGKDYFSFKFHGKKEIACKFCADLVIAEMGDGDCENVDKESLKKFIDEIAEYFLVAGNYAYADCIFVLREVVDEEVE